MKMGIEEVAWALRTARDAQPKRGCVLLIAAGCSVTAGIPAASGIVAAIREYYRPFYERAKDKTYPSVWRDSRRESVAM